MLVASCKQKEGALLMHMQRLQVQRCVSRCTYSDTENGNRARQLVGTSDRSIEMGRYQAFPTAGCEYCGRLECFPCTVEKLL